VLGLEDEAVQVISRMVLAISRQCLLNGWMGVTSCRDVLP
jgi:hypothetical protein